MNPDFISATHEPEVRSIFTLIHTHRASGAYIFDDTLHGLTFDTFERAVDELRRDVEQNIKDIPVDERTTQDKLMLLLLMRVWSDYDDLLPLIREYVKSKWDWDTHIVESTIAAK